MAELIPAQTAGKVYANSGPDDESVFDFNLKNQAFLHAYSQEQKIGKGVFFNCGPSLEKDLASSLNALSDNAKSSLSVRILLPKGTAQPLLNSYKNLSVEIKEMDRTQYRIHYFAWQNRTRLEKPIRVLVVDDSSTIRKMICKMLDDADGIQVVAEASLPSQVEGLIEQHKPDVITLDIHMPEMDGVTLLKKIAPKYHVPTIMVTALSMEDGSLVLDALENGAVDYLQKPQGSDLSSAAETMIEKIKSAATSKRVPVVTSTQNRRIQSQAVDLQQLIVIGSSTGGTEALRNVLEVLPEKIPPVLIVQHIPAVFSAALAQRLNTLCAFEVKEAADGDALQAGRVLIAPGGKQMRLRQASGQYFVQITDDAPVNRHKPSVDYLFDSVANVWKKKVIGIILTGMGADGAKGLLNLKNKGAHTIAQNEESCVVYGMPREAVKLNAAEKVIHLNRIPNQIVEWLLTAP